MLPLAAHAQTIDELLSPAAGSWPTYGRTPDMTRYSPLTQIDRSNVAELRLSWSRDLGFERSATVQLSPIFYGDVLYVHSPVHVLALAAASGEVLWQQVLTSAMEGAAMTYEVWGRQYFAVVAGAGSSTTGQTGLPPTVSGPAQLFVFSLP